MRKQKLIYGSLAVAAAAATMLATGRKSRKRVTRSNARSQTNASDAVDAPVIPPDATPDEVLDVAVEYTFPASDPIAITTSYRNALRREVEASG